MSSAQEIDRLNRRITRLEQAIRTLVPGGGSGLGGVTDHGALTGLADDDHTQYHNDTRADTWLAGTFTAATATVYVSKIGSDSDSGLRVYLPKLTIGASITVATALISGGADKVRIEVMDGGTYAENLVLGPDMILHAPAATVVGTLQLDDGCSALLDKQYPSAANDQVLISRITTGDGEVSSYRANIVDGRGVSGAVTGTICIQNESETGVVFCWVGQVFVAQGGFGIRDTAAAGFGHTHFILNDLYLGGNNAIGLRNTNAATNLIGYIDHILEIGTPTGTKGVQILASGGVVKLTASEIVADEAYDIAGGTLYLSCPKVTGTLTGTPTAILSDRLVKTAELQAITITAAAEKTTPVDADKFYEGDSAAGGILKWVSWVNIKATLTALFNSLYLVLLGTAGGQTAYGGTGSGDDLTLRSTSHATKGYVVIADEGGRVGIGTATPGEDITGTVYYPATVNLLEIGGNQYDRLIVKGSVNAGIDLVDSGAGDDLKRMLLYLESGVLHLLSYKDDGTVKTDNIVQINSAGLMTLGNGAIDANLYLDGAAAQYRSVAWLTNGSLRWLMRANNTAESGSNAGSDLELWSRTDAGGALSSSVIKAMRATGMIGLGVATPQGRLHVHDGTMGGLFVSKTGIVGSAVTIVPNGTGDVVRAVKIIGTAYETATPSPYQVDKWIAVGGSATIDSVPGGQTLTLACAADGSVTAQRTAGTATWSIGVLLVWL